MATIQQVEAGLRKAYEQGNMQYARILGAELLRLRETVSGRMAEAIEPTAMFPEAPAEPTVGEQVIGAGEAALTGVTGLTGGPVGMVGGTAASVTEQILSGQFGTPEAARAIEQAAAEGAQMFTYEPRTPAGRQIVSEVGEVIEQVVPPVLPIVGAPGAVTGPLRAARTRAEMGVDRGVQAAREGMGAARERVGAGIETVREAVGMEPRRKAARDAGVSLEPVERAPMAEEVPMPPVQRGIEPAETVVARDVTEEVRVAPTRITPEEAPKTTAAQLARIEKAESLPVPVSLTRGAATREAEQLAFEKEQMKGPLGQPLRNRIEENNLQALQNFDAMIDLTGAKAPDIAATGNAVIKALSEGYQAAKNKTRAAYTNARKSEGANERVDVEQTVRIGEGEEALETSVISYLNERPTGIPSSKVPDAAKKIAVKLDIASLDEDGNLVAKPTTVGKVEEFRREINSEIGYDPVDVRQGTIIKKLLDALVADKGGEMYREARKLRQDQARKYENRGVVARLVTNVRGMDDPKVAADQVFRKSILNASPDEIQFLKRVLMTSGDNGRQAWKEIQGATIRHIKEEGTKGMGMDSQGLPIVSPAQVNRVINQLDRNGRLDIIFGKESAQVIRDLNEVMKYVNTVPPGTLVNTSGTAGAIMAALGEMGATGAMTGLPVPVISLVKAATNQMKNNRLKARINEALNPKAEEE